LELTLLWSIPVTAFHHPVDVRTQSTHHYSTSPQEEFTVHVTHEGRSCSFGVRSNGETILAAMERSGVQDQLAISELPSDCRRGNCMTCSGRLTSPDASSLKRGEDGLSPALSQAVRDKGYVLTCSSSVVRDGVHLELGLCQEAWQEMYSDRLHSEETKALARSAVASTMRRRDERNVEMWAKETETLLEKTSDDDDDSAYSER